MRIVYEDLNELRRDVEKLVNDDKVVIRWWHIRPLHEIKRHEIIRALLHGVPLKPDREIEGRYVTWSKFTETGVLIKVVFEVWKADGQSVVVVTAFEEE